MTVTSTGTGTDGPQMTPYPRDVSRSPVGVGRAIPIAYRVALSHLVSTGRIVALTLLALTATLAGFAVGRSDSPDIDDAAAMIANLGFAVVIPVVCLVFGGGSLGDLREDKTLVYLWLRPMHRWPIVLGAALAALTMAAPITLVPIVAGAALTGVGSGLVGATAIASIVALVAYASVFTMLGVWLQRYIVWGLAYILIWEGFIASAGPGVAQFAIRKYTRSIIVDRTGADLGTADFSTFAGVVVPLLASIVALCVASWRLSHHDVD